MLPPPQFGHCALERPCAHFFRDARGLGASALALFALPSPPSVASPPSPPASSPAPRHSRHLPRCFPCPHLMPPPPSPAGAPDAALPALSLWAARGLVRSTCARGGGRGAVRSTHTRGGARGGTGGASCGWGGRLMVGAGGLGAGRRRAGWRAQCGRLGLVRAEWVSA